MVWYYFFHKYLCLLRFGSHTNTEKTRAGGRARTPARLLVCAKQAMTRLVRSHDGGGGVCGRRGQVSRSSSSRTGCERDILASGTERCGAGSLALLARHRSEPVDDATSVGSRFTTPTGLTSVLKNEFRSYVARVSRNFGGGPKN